MVEVFWGSVKPTEGEDKCLSHKIFGNFISVARLDIKHFICVTEELQL